MTATATMPVIALRYCSPAAADAVFASELFIATSLFSCSPIWSVPSLIRVLISVRISSSLFCRDSSSIWFWACM
ncbi:hypothetical protein D3C75_1192140 [compost metagenome]